MLNAAATAVVKVLRGAGQALDRAGRVLEVNPYVEGLLPSTRVIPFKKTQPSLDGVAFVAPSATVMGKVSLGQGSTVWYGAVMRGNASGESMGLLTDCPGDVNSITVGRNVCVGDRAMLHCSGDLLVNAPTVVGDNVVIGAGAVLHGCVVGDDCLIGDGAQILDGAKISSKVIILPGSLVPKDKTIPSGQVWGGMPASYKRDILPEELDLIASYSTENSKLGVIHAVECAKTWQQIEADEYDYEQIEERNDYYYQRLTKEELTKLEGEIQNHMIPGRVLDSRSKSFCVILSYLIFFLVSGRQSS